MGCKLEIKKILTLLMAIITLLLPSFVPVSKIVFAATTDTLTLSFDPQGNTSIDVGPNSYNFSSIWADSYQHTASNYFTVWNNGSADNMVVDAEVIVNPSNLVNKATPTGTQVDDTYSIRVRRGSVSNSTYISDDYWAQVDSDLDRGAPENFGLRLTLSNITSNWSWQTMQISVRGS